MGVGAIEGPSARRAAVPVVSRRLGGLVGQAADVSVAQPAVDEGEDLPRQRDPSDGTAAAFDDAVEVGHDLGRAALTSDALDGGPAHQWATREPRRTAQARSRAAWFAAAGGEEDRDECDHGDRVVGPEIESIYAGWQM